MLMRGFQYNDLVDRCLANLQQDGIEGGDGCALLDQLFGQRIAVANVELRFPLVRALVLGPGIGFLPSKASSSTMPAWRGGRAPVPSLRRESRPTRRSGESSPALASAGGSASSATDPRGRLRPLPGGAPRLAMADRRAAGLLNRTLTARSSHTGRALCQPCSPDLQK